MVEVMGAATPKEACSVSWTGVGRMMSFVVAEGGGGRRDSRRGELDVSE